MRSRPARHGEGSNAIQTTFEVIARPAHPARRPIRPRNPPERPVPSHLTTADGTLSSTPAAQTGTNIRARGTSEGSEPLYSTPIPTSRSRRRCGAASAVRCSRALSRSAGTSSCTSRSTRRGPCKGGRGREQLGDGASVASVAGTERVHVGARRGGHLAIRHGPVREHGVDCAAQWRSRDSPT